MPGQVSQLLHFGGRGRQAETFTTFLEWPLLLADHRLCSAFVQLYMSIHLLDLCCLLSELRA